VEGFIKLYRKLLDNPIFQNEKLLKVFIWCLLKATYKSYEQMVGLQIVKLSPGQFIYGRIKASEELKIKQSTLAGLLDSLRKRQIVNIKSNNKFSVITIVNWELYQSGEDETDNKSDNKATTNRQQTDTNKKLKNIENIKPLSEKSPTRIISDYFCSKYLSVYEMKYKFEAAKDGSNLSSLLKTYNQEECIKLIDLYFEFEDDWIQKNGRSISGLCSQFNLSKLSAFKQSQLSHKNNIIEFTGAKE
jgi:hypothetical protein